MNNAMPDFTIFPYDRYSLLLQWESGIDIQQNIKIHAFAKAISKYLPVDSTIPAFDSLLIIFKKPIEGHYQKDLQKVYDGLGLFTNQDKKINIPVCYDPSIAPDLPYIADYHQLTREEIIRLHCGHSYHVFMIGFLPGFPYLGPLPGALHTPRKSRPEPRIAPGSVGIGGSQTGIYPMISPGGWHIIGRTPLTLFDSSREGSFLLSGGETVQFESITLEAYNQYSRE